MSRSRYQLTVVGASPRQRQFAADDVATAWAMALGLVKREVAKRNGAGVQWRLDEIDWSRPARELRRVDC